MKLEIGKKYTAPGWDAWFMPIRDDEGENWQGVTCRRGILSIEFQKQDQPWIEYVGPKKKLLLAPALCKNRDGDFYVTGFLYSSEVDAQSENENFHSWPAVPNKDGFYENLT